MNFNSKYLFVALGFAIAIFIVWLFNAIISYILVAAVISIIGDPIVDFICKIKLYKWKISRGIGAAMALLIIWGVILLFLRFFVPLLADQAKIISAIDSQQILENLNEPLSRIESTIEYYNLNGDENFSVNEYASEKLVSFLNITHISKIFNSLAGFLGNIFVAIFAISFISFFFLKEEHLFLQMLLTVTPTKHSRAVKHALGSIRKLLIRYFLGMGLDVILIITLITTGLTIVGINFNNAIVIGFFAGLLNVIPYVGPIIAIFIGMAISMVTNIQLDFYTELVPLLGWVMLVFVIVQIVDATVFQPYIYSNSVNAHPLEIFIVIMIAGSLAGITGMLLAIPTYTVLRVIAKQFFNEFKIVRELTDSLE